MKVIILILVCLLNGCHHYPDNPIEEKLEEVIYNYTGVDIDFTSTDGK